MDLQVTYSALVSGYVQLKRMDEDLIRHFAFSPRDVLTRLKL